MDSVICYLKYTYSNQDPDTYMYRYGSIISEAMKNPRLSINTLGEWTIKDTNSHHVHTIALTASNTSYHPQPATPARLLLLLARLCLLL